MKTLIMITACFFCSSGLHAQQLSPEPHAARIAQRMKDSLSLSELQRARLQNINIELLQQQRLVMMQYSGKRDSIRVHLQRFENNRDSLYKQALSNEQYILYKKKKNKLLNNN